MIDFKELDSNGEQWELFARDFLSEIGFIIESPPDRGSDLGKDMIVIENLDGILAKYPFRWLVSCKNYAVSERSVTEDDEKSLLERTKGFNCDGFMGFYSTLPSAGLNSRLMQLKTNKELQDYKIFDSRLIENYLVKVGFSRLVMRFFPNSYKTLKPLHLITDKYIPLECEFCGKDLLEELNKEGFQANIALARKYGDDQTLVEDIYWACSENCDKIVEQNLYKNKGLLTGWVHISDLTIPAWYMRWILTTINELHSGTCKYTDTAFKKMKMFILAVGQKVLREMTEKERARVLDLIRFQMF